jgi:hypothetical protein
VRQNTGGNTAGIDGQTRRDIDPDMLSQLAKELNHLRQSRRLINLLAPQGGKFMSLPRRPCLSARVS